MFNKSLYWFAIWLFIKSNLDYENRLRGHMYQFEESDHKGNSIKKISMNKGGKGGIDNNSNNEKNELKWLFYIIFQSYYHYYY